MERLAKVPQRWEGWGGAFVGAQQNTMSNASHSLQLIQLENSFRVILLLPFHVLTFKKYEKVL